MNERLKTESWKYTGPVLENLLSLRPASSPENTIKQTKHIVLSQNNDFLELNYAVAKSDQDKYIEFNNSITVNKNSHVKIIEYFTSDCACVRSGVTDIMVHEGSSVEYYKIQQEHVNTIHIGQTNIILDKNSHIKTFILSTGSLLARNDLNIYFKAEHSTCELYGLYQSKNRQHLDHHTMVDHAFPHCKSTEFYRGVLDDHSRAVFNGKVIVREGAHHTEASQLNHNLLLSSNAEIDTKPELEIYHDDIKCSHGAAVGQLDESALFYLQSRGIAEKEARELLIKGFKHKILNYITDSDVRKKLCLD